MPVIVTNRIPVAEGHTLEFEERFRTRIHLVDQSPGFLRNEVHRPRPMKFVPDTGEWVTNPEEEGYYEVKTWWRSMDDFINWTRSESFRIAHSNRPPKEMFRGASKLLIHEIVTSTDMNDSTDLID